MQPDVHTAGCVALYTVRAPFFQSTFWRSSPLVSFKGGSSKTGRLAVTVATLFDMFRFDSKGSPYFIEDMRLLPVSKAFRCLGSSLDHGLK